MSAPRVLIADPHTIFRSAVASLLAQEGDFEVVHAANLGELVDVVSAECPTIALVDLDLPPGGGVAAVEYLSERCNAQTVVWSFEQHPAAVLAAIRAGARGFLNKEISPQALVRALRGLVGGEAAISRDLSAVLIDALHRIERRDRVHELASLLSSREREVLDLVAKGAQNKQIAVSLTISEFTVKRHVQNILHKLGVPTRRAASALYRASAAATDLSPVYGNLA